MSSSSNSSGDAWLKLNGTTIDTWSWVTTTSNPRITNISDVEKALIVYYWKKTSGGSVTQTSCQLQTDGGTPIYPNPIDPEGRKFNLNEGKITLYYNYVGYPDGTPTYFETLDKLDQWSSAQYIPDMRNSRNKLNL